MKLLLLTIFLFATSLAAEWEEIDLSMVIGRDEDPNFWKNVDDSMKPPKTDPRRETRIRGGWEVEPNSHAYAVAILSSTATGTFRCGSSIISSRAILTAAHCPIGTISTLAIMGAHNMAIIEPTQERRTISSDNYRLHPNFNGNTLANDIAILIMPTDVHETPYIRYSRLPHEFRNEMFFGEMVTVVGWGRTCTNCAASNVLRGVTNPIMTTEACRQYFSTVGPNFLCMQTGDVGGTCPGDSGGPYTVERPGSPNRVQVSVHCFGASSAVGGCDAGWPSGSTRVTAFLDWIDANMIP